MKHNIVLEDEVKEIKDALEKKVMRMATKTVYDDSYSQALADNNINNY